MNCYNFYGAANDNYYDDDVILHMSTMSSHSKKALPIAAMEFGEREASRQRALLPPDSFPHAFQFIPCSWNILPESSTMISCPPRLQEDGVKCLTVEGKGGRDCHVRRGRSSLLVRRSVREQK